MEGKVFYERIAFFALCEDAHGFQEILPASYGYWGELNFIVYGKTDYLLGIFYSEEQPLDGEVV